jgi:hypothetical protein
MASSSYFATRFALRIQRGTQEVGVVHAGNFDGVLERKENARSRAFFWFHGQQVLPVELDGPGGDFIAFAARKHMPQRRFARTVRTHDGVQLAGFKTSGSGP